jgi:5'(3')-deoxyribonucleotidase
VVKINAGSKEQIRESELYVVWTPYTLYTSLFKLKVINESYPRIPLHKINFAAGKSKTSLDIMYNLMLHKLSQQNIRL